MKSIALTDREAALAAQGKLTALVRVMKPQPPAHHWASLPGYKEWFVMLACTDGYWARLYRSIPSNPNFDASFSARSPFGAPGDVLAGKETYALCDCRAPSCSGVVYRANGEFVVDDVVWLAPITMPAWAIRHHFTVKAVRAMLAKDVTPGLLLEMVSYDWESFYRRYGDDKTWVWYCELEAI